MSLSEQSVNVGLYIIVGVHNIGVWVSVWECVRLCVSAALWLHHSRKSAGTGEVRGILTEVWQALW